MLQTRTPHLHRPLYFRVVKQKSTVRPRPKSFSIKGGGADLRRIRRPDHILQIIAAPTGQAPPIPTGLAAGTPGWTVPSRAPLRSELPVRSPASFFRQV